MTQKLKRNLTANGIDIRTVLSADQQDYISLTDIAKYKSKDPNDTIRNWLRGREVNDD